MTDERPVISLRNLRKSYGTFELGPIELDVQPGYVVAIVGPNGGGKSTLMGMLMNLIQPTSGEITLFGGAYPEDEVAVKRRIGYAPERPSPIANDGRTTAKWPLRYRPVVRGRLRLCTSRWPRGEQASSTPGNLGR